MAELKMQKVKAPPASTGGGARRGESKKVYELLKADKGNWYLVTSHTSNNGANGKATRMRMQYPDLEVTMRGTDVYARYVGEK